MSRREPDPSSFRDVVDPAVAAAYRAAGWWGETTMSGRVEELARERPADVAFHVADRSLTWEQYDEQAWRLAAAFVEAGLAPGERIAVLLPDGATVHVVFVAAERAGLTTVGIGARAGDLEVAHLLRRTDAAALVTLAEQGGEPWADRVERLRERHGVDELVHLTVPVVEVDPDHPVMTVDGPLRRTGDGRAICAGRSLGSDDLFMINSTSGTTGLPKCVQHTQNRWMYFHQKAVEFGGLGDEVILGGVPAPFGFGLWTAHFTPALLGAPTVVMERFTADRALHLIEEHGVTMLCCVSTQFLLMMNSPAFSAADLSSLRVMFTGGEPVPFERAKEWEERTGSMVLQFFGSNETGLLTGTRREDTTDQRLRTCGRIVDEMQVRLFEDGRDVTETGRGQPGCKGPATSLGYLDDPAANAELFTADGWMLMADECELAGDGYLRIIGRKSDLIIRGGKNISAPEVERQVSSHPAVGLAAAVPAPDPVFGERVCVFVELMAGADSLTLDELNAHLRESGVSKELFPERLVLVDELPRSSGGKVAKGRLRAEAQADPTMGESAV